jgi:hypothetical protein
MAMSPRAFLRYLVLPARPSGALLIGVLSAGLVLATRAGFVGVPLGLMLLSWLFTYAFVLLEHVAHGSVEPPVLAVEMVNPLSQGRPLAQLSIALLGYAALRSLAQPLGPALLSVVEGLLLLALPALIAALGVAEHWWQALAPRALWSLVRAMGVWYWTLPGLALLYGAALVGLYEYGLAGWLLYAIGAFAWLSWYASIGGALFEARAALGFEAMHAPERAAARRDAQQEQLRARFMDGIYGQARGGNHAGAWQTMQRELAAHRHAFETYEWMLARLAGPELRLLAQRLAQEMVSRSLDRDNGRVLRIVRERLRLDPNFRPRLAAETTRVAELARLAGDRALAARLEGAASERT